MLLRRFTLVRKDDVSLYFCVIFYDTQVSAAVTFVIFLFENNVMCTGKKIMHLSFLLFPLSVVCITAEAVKLTALKKILRIRLVQAGQGSQAQLKAGSNSNCSADSLMRSYW